MTDSDQVTAEVQKKEKKLTRKQRAFIEFYLQTWNATTAATQAGYKDANNLGPRQLQNDLVKAEIEKHLQENKIKADEVITRLAQMAQANPAQFFTFDEVIDPDTNETQLQMTGINWTAVQEKGFLIKKIAYTRQGKPILEFHDPQVALDRLGRHLGLFSEKSTQASDQESNGRLVSLPADLIAPSFLGAYRDIRDHLHTEYVFHGGRGSTKSSFISLVMIWLLVRNPGVHGLACRQVANTLRDSVYAQLVWAVNELGLGADFSCTTSPLEIVYKPTGQKIYFRGADDPGKIKSIKPKFGYIGLLWFEELDQFHGEEAIRKIEQSVIRGGDLAYIFKSFNPPRTAANWANKYTKIPKAAQSQHESNYLNVPAEWLGKTFFDEAEYLKSVNPKAYEHEYLGIANGTGGLVFENVSLRKITDEEIAQFDRLLFGIDWGYFPDPFAWGKMYYNAAQHRLYIFDEMKANKKSNRAVYDLLVKEKRISPNDLQIADSAEPKSIADFREYGANIRGAEKGPDSVDYSIKWLQSLVEIVIDPERAPEHANEFINYELEQDKDGNFISSYPDKNNHFIDDTRYGTNMIWRRRGQ